MAGKTRSPAADSPAAELVERPRKFGTYLASRIFAYSLLKRVFLEEPTKEFLELLLAEDLLEVFPYQSDGEIKEGVELIANYLARDDALEDDQVVELMADFTQLFIGPDTPRAYPYESTYRSEEKLVFQRETIKVRRRYEKYNLQVEKYRSEPDDHIAFELAFMAHLSENALEAVKEKSTSRLKRVLIDQRSFLSDHMLQWVPELSDRAVDAARYDFYRGFAKVLVGYLRVESKELAAVVKELRAKQKRERKLESVKSEASNGDASLASEEKPTSDGSSS